MKGILLCGGSGSRLYPLTKVINKHLLPISNRPMAQYGIDKFVGAGIFDIMVITGFEHAGSFVEMFGDGSEYNCNITYKFQSKAGGIAQALGLAKDFVGDDSCVVLLGDNIFKQSLRELIDDWEEHNARVVYSEVSDPERYGVIKYEGLPGKSKVVCIEEKPKYPPSNHAVTGIYMYPSKKLNTLSPFDVISKLEPSARGEFEVTDLNNRYCEEGLMEFKRMEGYWTDAGTFDSLFRANELVKVEEPMF
jgi:glucose-1-phosphate thymidylyltransferase